MRRLDITVTAEEHGWQLQKMLKAHGFSHRAITKLKHSGGLTRGGEIIRSIDTLAEGDVITVLLEDEGGLVPNSELRADIAYEDEDIVVFEKPPFMAVHPSIKHRNDTLGNLFAAMFPDTPFRVINRLDRNTSGLCVCAKNRFAAAALAKQVSKVYYAVVDGEMGSGEIDVPIGRVQDSIIYRNVTPDGQPALTLYSDERHGNGRTLSRIILKTGRTHQIRVHFAYIGFPLCGDEMYGGDLTAINRQALHCGEVSFTHPVSGEKITLTSPIPQDMEQLLTEKENS